MNSECCQIQLSLLSQSSKPLSKLQSLSHPTLLTQKFFHEFKIQEMDPLWKLSVQYICQEGQMPPPPGSLALHPMFACYCLPHLHPWFISHHLMIKVPSSCPLLKFIFYAYDFLHLLCDEYYHNVCKIHLTQILLINMNYINKIVLHQFSKILAPLKGGGETLFMSFMQEG